ncbi:MAG: xanthine dehydrogenase subunit D [Acidimicrobiales bacterium]
MSKAEGRFAYSSDLWAEDMLWGATLRSPHPRARIAGIDISRALGVAGVAAVLLHDDVPGSKTFGLEIPDQPVLANDQVRYQGEAVAIVAADHPETARLAASMIEVAYTPLAPVTSAGDALDDAAPSLHPGGNCLRQVRIRRGSEDCTAEVVVKGTYEVGMQDQAPLGPESGLAIPTGDGGVELYVSTQWLHADRRQIAASLGVPEAKVTISLAGVGGAFGAREDLSMQVHASLLALRTGRPVKMMYSREESFFGHVHRHPATMEYEHGARRDGKLVYLRARLVLDGGAYASSSTAVVSNAACFAAGPYEVGNVSVDATVAYTNNPPCGAMRGFGAVQVCFAYESQMDKLAAALGMSPVDVRLANAMSQGSLLPTGQAVAGPAPVAEMVSRLAVLPLPGTARAGSPDAFPGGASNTTHGEGVRRGVGYAVGFKNIAFSEGFDDYSTASVTLSAPGGEALAQVRTAAVEVGQGLVTVQAQIARSELGVERVEVGTASTAVGSAGSSSASRQTWMTGGAVKLACEAVREQVLRMASAWLERDPAGLVLDRGAVHSYDGAETVSLAELLGGGSVEATRCHRHRPTVPLDPATGQGEAHVSFSFAAHRAVVDVDTELGLVKVVELAVAQDVGRAINPLAVTGQLEGGSAQGLGLALMEEIRMSAGRVLNPSFTDYLVPTMLDMPPVVCEVLEIPDPEAPYGAKGIGEAPTISSTPAIVAAIRAACGRELPRVPVRPEHIVGL